MFLCLTGLAPLAGLAEPRVVNYSEINGKFEQIQDQQGFLWQVNQEGDITSGATQYLPSGMKLFVNGAPFKPASASLTDSTAMPEGTGVDLSLRGEATADFEVTRHFWIDQRRGGVRIIDTIRNKGAAAKAVVELKSAFQFPWQNLAGSSGGILGGDSVIKLDDRDLGVLAKFSAADGRQDTIVLFRASAGDALSPRVSASSNSRELVLEYQLGIAAGQSISLAHWLLQRNLGGVEETGKSLAPFLENKQLTHSRVDPKLAATVVNFPASAFPAASDEPKALRELLCLNEKLNRLGVRRASSDLLLPGGTNRLEGRLAPDGKIKVGEVSLPLADIAALEGGAGTGRTPRVYLRDGTVRSGPFAFENLSLLVGKDWKVEDFDCASLNWLLLGLKGSDGTAPSGTKALIELRSGQVHAVSALSSGLKMMTVGGSRTISLEELESLQYLSGPRPEYRVQLAGGSSFGAFFANAPVEALETVGGAALSFVPQSIRRIWKPGKLPPAPELFQDPWVDFRDVPPSLLSGQCLLLKGNNLLCGALAPSPPLTMVDGASVIDVSPGEIVSLRKTGSGANRFALELRNGNILEGSLRQSHLAVGTDASAWQVPLRHIIAYRLKG